MTARLRLERVTRTYGAAPHVVTALDDVSFDARGGELVAVMGPSGSGKSTLLAVAGGLEAPDAGRVLLDDEDLACASPTRLAELRRRALGFVFQDDDLVPGLTARENVALPLELDGAPRRECARAADEALASVDLGARAERFPEELSGGERRRVALARALVGPRRVLLADEPTGALDTLNGERVMRLLRAAADGGHLAVVVTHDASHAAWADRVLSLRDGRLAPMSGSREAAS